jgi:peptidoglycan hydrolase CwlO-like protein
VLALAAALALTWPVAAGTAGADTGTQLGDAQAQLDELVSQIRSAAAERDALREQMEDLLRHIDQNRRALDGTQADIDTAHAQVAELQERVATQQSALDHRAAETYIMGRTHALEVALGAASMSDFQVILEYLDATALSDRNLIDGLARQKAELGARQDDLAALRSQLEGTKADLEASAATLGTQLDRQEAAVSSLEAQRMQAEALVQDLGDQQAREAARETIHEAGGDPSPAPTSPPAPTPDPEPLPPDPGPDAVKALIVQHFTPLGDENVDIAMCVAERESHFDAHAENPVSGAAGVFQFLPSTWDLFAPAAGWGGHSPFEAEANVAVAAWTVSNYGWSSWDSDGNACGF